MPLRGCWDEDRLGPDVRRSEAWTRTDSRVSSVSRCDACVPEHVGAIRPRERALLKLMLPSSLYKFRNSYPNVMINTCVQYRSQQDRASVSAVTTIVACPPCPLPLRHDVECVVT
jgi:hypothetical protein